MNPRTYIAAFGVLATLALNPLTGGAMATCVAPQAYAQALVAQPAATTDLSGYVQRTEVPALVQQNAPVQAVNGATGSVTVPVYTDAQATAAAQAAGFATTAQATSAANTAAAAIPTDVAAGSYTIGTLPSATANASKRVLVTDLGRRPCLRAGGRDQRLLEARRSAQQLPDADSGPDQHAHLSRQWRRGAGDGWADGQSRLVA